ncbi:MULTISPECIES: hypothetical protein [Bacillus]
MTNTINIDPVLFTPTFRLAEL